MSIFDNVKELVDYDYTLEEAKQELYGRASENIIEICYERLQEMKLQKERIERNIGKADRTPGKQNPKMHSRDMNIPFWELLYREGRDEINTIIKTFGTSLAAKYFRVDRKVILALRQHFNYQLVPGTGKSTAPIFQKKSAEALIKEIIEGVFAVMANSTRKPEDLKPSAFTTIK